MLPRAQESLLDGHSAFWRFLGIVKPLFHSFARRNSVNCLRTELTDNQNALLKKKKHVVGESRINISETCGG